MTKTDFGRSHVLITLGVLFSLAGAMRFLPDNQAIAAEPLLSGTPELEPPGEPAVDHAATEVNPEESQVCFTGETAAALLEDQSILVSEQQDLKEQNLSLQLRQQELETQRIELQTLQTTLTARWEEIQGTADGDMQHLASMYAAMKPDEAASIFNKMDPDFAAGFLRLLPSDHAGQIVASMETNKAYIVSVKMATRNSDIRNATTSRQ